MITLLLHLLRLLPFLVGGHRELALENLAVRQQLVIYKRTVIRPSLRRRDRLFWVGLAKIWAGWSGLSCSSRPTMNYPITCRHFRTETAGLLFGSSCLLPLEGTQRRNALSMVAGAGFEPVTFGL